MEKAYYSCDCHPDCNYNGIQSDRTFYWIRYLLRKNSFEAKKTENSLVISGILDYIKYNAISVEKWRK